MELYFFEGPKTSGLMVELPLFKDPVHKIGMWNDTSKMIEYKQSAQIGVALKPLPFLICLPQLFKMKSCGRLLIALRWLQYHINSLVEDSNKRHINNLSKKKKKKV